MAEPEEPLNPDRGHAPLSGGRIIRSTADLDEGLVYLRSREPRFDAFLAESPSVPLRRTEPGFSTLLHSVVSQQLSVASADAIWGRMTARRPPTAEAFHRARSSSLAAAGLSRPKISYAKELARAVLDGSLPLDRLENMPEEEAIAALTSVKGIGRWTAEIYLMFALGRADVIAAGDLALQEAARMMFGLSERPSESQLRELAAAWLPWRAVAARVLWKYYRHARNREGVAIGNPAD